MEFKIGYRVKIRPSSEIDWCKSPGYNSEMEKVVKANNRIFIITDYRSAYSHYLLYAPNNTTDCYGRTIGSRTYVYSEEMFDILWTRKEIKAFDTISKLCEKKCKNCSYGECELVKSIYKGLLKWAEKYTLI